METAESPPAGRSGEETPENAIPESRVLVIMTGTYSYVLVVVGLDGSLIYGCYRRNHLHEKVGHWLRTGMGITLYLLANTISC